MVMKYTKYIAILSALLFTACATELIEPSLDLDGNDMVQLVSRVIPFSDRDVATRANKNDAEVKVSSIAYFIFQKNGECIFHKRVTTTDPLSIDRSSSELANYVLTECYIISIANAPEFNVTPGETTWDDVSSQTVNVSGVAIPSGGLAMIGRYPKEENTFIDLTATAPGEVLTIPMQSVFSKIKVNINVDSDQRIPGEGQPNPTFTLKGAEVHNVASAVDFIGGNESGAGLIDGTNDDTAVNTESYVIEAFGETSDGGTAVSFSFYLPERFLLAGTSASTFQYPFGKGTAIRAEDMGYRQRYKPMLAKGFDAYNSKYVESKDKKATYVTINGTYSDHQGHSFNVSYDIYVGRDNYGNFDIVRNTQYNNNVTIRGINNSSDQSADNAAVSIDHRVNVERMDPIIINFRRETLLDSHFEVRPLRIRKNPNYTGSLANAKVKVEVEYAQNTASNWIGLERSYGNGAAVSTSTTYLVDSDLADDRKNSAGKRKYFTTDLTTGTLNSNGTFGSDGFSTAGGRTVVVPVSEQEQCVWLYVDECTTANDNVRTATIKVSYTTDGTKYSEPVKYVINQRELFPVTYDGNTYLIEYHEEYLHNYDSDDQYGQTEYEGMEWGLDGVQLSFEEDALYFDSSGGWLDDIITLIINFIKSSVGVRPQYDFYISKHDTEVSSQAAKYSNNGYEFCKKIIGVVNNENMVYNSGGWFGQPSYTKPDLNTETSDDIKALTLAENPRSAVEYCLNKNKRKADGSIISSSSQSGMNTDLVFWYLPAIDEIENIVMSEYGDGQKTYSRFEDFQEKFYWSSQPAYIRNHALYDKSPEKRGKYYYDDVNYARATSVKYSNGTYDYERSGVTSDYHALRIYGGSAFNPNTELITTGTFDNVELGTIVRQKGNKPRANSSDAYARVRCVRKNPAN